MQTYDMPNKIKFLRWPSVNTFSTPHRSGNTLSILPGTDYGKSSRRGVLAIQPAGRRRMDGRCATPCKLWSSAAIEVISAFGAWAMGLPHYNRSLLVNVA